jgi:hypothetical protein
MSIYLLYTLKEVLYSNSYVQNILQTDDATITCMIFGLNKNTIQSLCTSTEATTVPNSCGSTKWGGEQITQNDVKLPARVKTDNKPLHLLQHRS